MPGCTIDMRSRFWGLPNDSFPGGLPYLLNLASSTRFAEQDISHTCFDDEIPEDEYVSRPCAPFSLKEFHQPLLVDSSPAQIEWALVGGTVAIGDKPRYGIKLPA